MTAAGIIAQNVKSRIPLSQRPAAALGWIEPIVNIQTSLSFFVGLIC